MKKRMILMLVAVVVFVAAIGSFKFLQIKKAMGQVYTPPPEAVTTTVVKAESWPAEMSAIGSVAATQGVTVSADASGIVSAIEFDSGKNVTAGAVLVRLDTKQEQAQLAAAEAQRELARVSLKRFTDLSGQGVVAKADLDKAAAESRQAEARVNEIRATIARKTIRAPFAGVLGIRQVNLGQHLSEGAAVVPLQALDPVYVNFSVPQQQIAGLSPGVEVKVTAEGTPGELVGKLTAVDSLVDAATRNVQAQATFSNPGGKLRPGMFVKAHVTLPASTAVVAIPASAVAYAPYGDSVYVVTELDDPKGNKYKGVKQQFVKLGAGKGDQVAVLSGLKSGDEVVTTGAFKLRNGAAVLVDNTTQPSNSKAPTPENS